MSIRRNFETVAKNTSRYLGHPTAFVIALLSIVVWALLGPVYKYSDTWQLVVNTATTIITFLMVFLIQNSQNRDNAAIQAKLDELIRAGKGAKNEMISLEELSSEELEHYHEHFSKLAEQARSKLSQAVVATQGAVNATASAEDDVRKLQAVVR